MRFAFMSFSTPELDLADMLSLADELAYDGIEPRLDADHRHGVEVECTAEERQSIRDLASESRLQLACLATSCRFADQEERDGMLDDAHERIDLAGDVGAPCIRVFGGRYPERLTREEAIQGLAEALTDLADHAGEREVTVCLETHDAWCDPLHVAEVLRRVDHTAVGTNWDIMHPVRTGLASIEESFEALKPWIRHLHVHDGRFDQASMELTPIGEGQVDHRRALELLNDISYDGFISGEWINWEPYEDHLPRELCTLRNYEEAVVNG
jgi:sugar phosphate isomerase/epimerase